MKKVAIVVLVSLFSSGIYSIDNNTVVKKQSRLTSIVKSTYKIVNENIDYVLTSKGAIKTLIVLSPIIILYCRYFNYSPIKGIINRVINLIGYAKKTYNIQYELGESEAYFEFMTNTPRKSLKIIISKFIDKIINTGIPFITGLVANRYISKK